jgi:hypothetical protein
MEKVSREELEHVLREALAQEDVEEKICQRFYQLQQYQ